MAIFKCKMCGGTLEVQEDQTTAICDYCGTRQTLPRLSSDRRANLYDRANHFRRNNEYDKAAGIYEQILNEDGTDAEAYWSLVLCRYGIEYVDDPATHRRIPTINRAQFTSIFDDDNYRSALAHADASQRGIYEQEAAAINELQRGILEISQREEPFDVFLCYKETDQNGRRTPDSVLAGELYHELTDAGYRVFFSRVTLEDKLGTAYEPYIFAALQSARVMVVLGTRPEYFNAVWVKNEWSRYLALIRNGAKKVLIPAYRDMDPYDLPEEFSHLQAQDMGKLGFMQDLLRGIGKLAGPAATQAAQPVQAAQAAQPAPATAASAPLLRRAFLFLEDGEWNSANEYCERVLDVDPENAEAYMGKLMAELQCPRREALKDCAEPFDGLDSYKKALRFGDERLRVELQGAVAFIRERNEQARLATAYDEAVQKMRAARSQKAYLDAAALFDRLPGFRDADTLAAECRERAQLCVYDAAREFMQAAKTAKDYQAAAQEFARIPGYRDADTLAAECQERAQLCVYNEAAQKMQAACGRKSYLDAAALFASIPGFRDADTLAAECQERAQLCVYDPAREFMQAAKTIGAYQTAAREFARIPGFRDADALAIECQERITILHRQFKRRLAFMAVLVVIAILIAILYKQIFLPPIQYHNAEKLLEAGQYEDAIAAFEALGAYDDAANRSLECRYAMAEDLEKEGRSAEAAMAFGKAAGYRDAGERSAALWEEVVPRAPIAAGSYHTVGLRKNGTVIATGDNDDGQCNVSGWSDVVAVAAGNYHTIGLRADGTVVATGWNDYGQCDVSGWKDVVAIAAGSYHTVGLRKDGTVLATGLNSSGQCDVSGWSDVVAVAAGSYHTVGLRADGTVVATGNNEYGQRDVSDWKDVVAIAVGNDHTIGLRKDGTVLATGRNSYGKCDLSDWKDVVAVAAGYDHTVALRRDSTVIATGWNVYGQCDVAGWSDIVAIAAGAFHTVGLRADGTVLATGWNSDGQCDIAGRIIIRLP